MRISSSLTELASFSLFDVEVDEKVGDTYLWELLEENECETDELISKKLNKI